MKINIKQRLENMMNERGWTRYQLAKYSGLSESTVANIFKRDSCPSIATLESICNSMGVSLSEFFSEGDMQELTPELKELYDSWITLTGEQKTAILNLMKAMHR